MSSGGAQQAEYFCVKIIFLKRVIRKGDCARITFRTPLKIAGKTTFCTFCTLHIPQKTLLNPKVIFIFIH
jgi:hypothetical protein